MHIRLSYDVWCHITPAYIHITLISYIISSHIISNHIISHRIKSWYQIARDLYHTYLEVCHTLTFKFNSFWSGSWLIFTFYTVGGLRMHPRRISVINRETAPRKIIQDTKRERPQILRVYLRMNMFVFFLGGELDVCRTLSVFLIIFSLMSLLFKILCKFQRRSSFIGFASSRNETSEDGTWRLVTPDALTCSRKGQYNPIIKALFRHFLVNNSRKKTLKNWLFTIEAFQNWRRNLVIRAKKCSRGERLVLSEEWLDDKAHGFLMHFSWHTPLQPRFQSTKIHMFLHNFAASVGCWSLIQLLYP